MENATPMLRQYLEIKKNYPGTILFFRLGDFYEMFNEDAVIGSRELSITLTARQKDSLNPIPMCGVPHHAAAGYIAKLVRKGYRVAICEQSEPATKGTKLVRRDVVRVITPGTAFEEQLSDDSEQTFLAAIAFENDLIGSAFLDLSTGEFFAAESPVSNGQHIIGGHLERTAPCEILIERNELELAKAQLTYFANARSGDGLFGNHGETASTGRGVAAVITELDDCRNDDRAATELLKKHFGVLELSGFGIEGRPAAIRAAAMCIDYAQRTQRSSVSHINAITFVQEQEFLVLDGVTLSNLEIVKPRNEGNGKTLFNILDESVTSMGARLLKAWLVRPLTKRSEIQTRQLAVSELMSPELRETVRYLLKGIIDLERLTGKLNLASISPRELLSLNTSLEKLPELKLCINDASSLLLQVLSENIFELAEVRELLSSAIADEPPANISDGGYIRPGYNAELDELRSLASSVKSTIAAFEDTERIRTGIPTLKIRFNNVFGYYIEVSKAHVQKVPDDYERRQTLANAERYTTGSLKDWENRVLGAEEKIAKLEKDLLSAVIEQVRSETQQLQSTARALATLDALASLASVAAKRNYVQPTFHDGDEISIVKGRHPVVETGLGESFVPNDIVLNNSTDRLAIVTGANMGGKSTILRQVGLIQIMAQIGSFVPASSARLPIVDRVWTRVGASDDLSSGRSTFMVEMTETAAILHSATPRSLVLLDEIGRGTSTFDGLSIAWAVAEYLHNSPEHSAKTIFATHYHELTELAEELPGAKNYQLMATERDGDVVFLHRLERGKASKSYGIAVAKLAGLPVSVIERAKHVLEKLEKYELAVFADEKKTGLGAAANRSAATQISLFAIANESAIDTLRNTDVDSLSNDETRGLLEHLKKKIV